MTSASLRTLGKAFAILAALEAGPATASEVAEAVGLSGTTAHRQLQELVEMHVVARDHAYLYQIGPRILQLAAAAGSDHLIGAARPILLDLRDLTGEAVQLYRRQSERRLCVAAAQRPVGLQTVVTVGEHRPLTGGAAAKVLLAWQPPEQVAAAVAQAQFGPRGLSEVRRRGWAQSLAEITPDLASVAAPVRAHDGQVIAALTLTGLRSRIGEAPGAKHAQAVLEAASRLTAAYATNDPAW